MAPCIDYGSLTQLCVWSCNNGTDWYIWSNINEFCKKRANGVKSIKPVCANSEKYLDVCTNSNWSYSTVYLMLLYLLLYQRYVWQDEQTVVLPAKQLSEDEDFGNKGFSSTGGKRVDQIFPRLNTLQVQTRLLPVWEKTNTIILCPKVNWKEQKCCLANWVVTSGKQQRCWVFWHQKQKHMWRTIFTS